MTEAVQENQPLSPDDVEALKQNILKLKERLDQEEERREKYKIEVVFSRKKTNRGPFGGSIILMRSRSAMNGDGDELMYPCPSLADGPKCPGLIPPENVSTFLDVAVCPECGTNWPRKKLSDSTFYLVDAAQWAFILSREFHRCGCNASIYMKTSGMDLREQSRLELAKPQRGDALRDARLSRGYAMYQMYRILQDVSAGATLEKLLKAFITG